MKLDPIKSCRVCGSGNLREVFSLGDQYIATTFLEKKSDVEQHERYPLDLVICGPEQENGCGFVQLHHTIPRDVLFEKYWYRSGINQTMRDALAEVVSKAQSYTDLTNDDVVCDIGCNDGTLLSFYPKSLTRIGIDPAKNMAEYSKPNASIIVSDYFSSDVFFEVSNRKAKVVTSIAMFYSVETPVDFAQSIYRILDENGVWVLQMSSLPLMLRNNCYDNIVHEHVGYYTLDVMDQLLNKEGLHIIDVEINDINAGSFRLYVKKSTSKATSRLEILRELERREGYRNLAIYKKFETSVQNQTQKLIEFMKTCNPEETCFCGASTKGNVILQHAELNDNYAFGIAERNPLKHGLFTLGSNLKIISEEEMRQRKPRNVIVLPYHFRNEIMVREAQLLNSGTKFIFPLPQFDIVLK